MTVWTGTPALPVAANGNQIDGSDINAIASALHGLSDVWTAFATAWTSTGTTPAIGNGTITSRYIQANKLVAFRGQILWGSTTTGGTGTWLLSLPVQALDGAQSGAALLIDSSTSANRQPAAVLGSGLSQILFYEASGGLVTVTTPFVWATGDALDWTYIYEAA